jgi:hypothetical protein
MSMGLIQIHVSPWIYILAVSSSRTVAVGGSSCQNDDGQALGPFLPEVQCHGSFDLSLTVT